MVAALASVLASSADEGKNIILSMLVVGLIFLAVILLGDLSASRARKRKYRKTARRTF